MATADSIPQFSQLATYVGDLRSWVFKHRSAAARHFRVHHTTIGRYESGESTPPLEYLACLAVLVAERLTVQPLRKDKTKQKLLMEVNKAIDLCYPGKQSLRTWDDLCRVADTYRPKQSSSRTPDYSVPAPKQDWGTAPAISRFVGRKDALERLSQWIVHDRCRVVGLLGIGGVGKTWLASALVKRVLPDFTRFIWRSLRDAPPLAEIVNDYIHFLSDQQTYELPSSSDQRITILINLMRQQRCLLVLDNVESILKKGIGAGRYREGYESYGELLHAIGTTDHQSCLILTSRDTPAQLALLSGIWSPVRTWPLGGLDSQAASVLLAESKLQGSTEELAKLATHFSGNPLVLQLVAGAIHTLFDGKIADFLQIGIAFLGDVRNLLDEQFQRLSQQERDVLYWLAILREPVTHDELMAYMAPVRPKHHLIETLQDLQRRFWIETGNGFSLQNVILEYLTERLVHKMSDEILKLAPKRFKRHALALAQSKYYIRDVQMRLLLQSVAQQISEALGKEKAIQQLLALKAILQTKSIVDTDYAGANIIHLLMHLNQGNLRGQDFSKLAIREAILQQNVDLIDANFSYANLINCSFLETFGSVNDLAFSPDGQWLAVATTNGILRMWCIVQHGSNASTTGLRYSFENPLELGQQVCSDTLRIYREKGKSIESITFHPSGEILASAHEDGSIHLWEAKSGRHLEILWGHSARVRSLAFDALGDILVSSSDDCTVRLWDTHTWQARGVLEGHTDHVFALACSPAAPLLASGSLDGTICLWDIRTLDRISVLRNEQVFGTESVVFSPDGSLLVSGGSRGTICLWDVQAGKYLKNLHSHQHQVNSVRLSPKGDLLVSASYDRSVRLSDVSTGECIKVLLGHRNPVDIAIFHPNRELVASGGEDGSVRLWNTVTGQCLGVQQGCSNRIWALAASPVENLLASGGDDGRVRLWDLQSGKCRHTLLAFTYLVRTVAFSADGRLLASGADDLTVRLWRTHTGECIHVLRGHTERMLSLAFNPKGRILASGSVDKTVRVWDVDSGYCFQVLQECSDRVYSIIYNSEGSILITGAADGKVQLWDAQTGTNLMTLVGHHKKPIQDIALSQSGQFLASAGNDIVQLWDLHSGQSFASFERGWAVVFHPRNDDMLFMLSRDRLTPQLVDIQRDEVVYSYPSARDSIISLTVSADERLLIGAGDDGVIRLWEIKSGECVKILQPERTYERMNITGMRGLTETQKNSLKMLGAVEPTKY